MKAGDSFQYKLHSRKFKGKVTHDDIENGYVTIYEKDHSKLYIPIKLLTTLNTSLERR
ncbi:hypothetical protein BN990_04148 [Virgibacillus salexigens]|uniref:Uncharacterized protein n=1 Tax=Virgibacillus massiliensis TaxID=1462526 RepID=A0A024QII1_9BACI|nr:hypothetical protein BN990_04148 [Virgibacillus massiliensis]